MARRVPSVGPTPARCMLVGEAPGQNEELEGAPFVGAAGQELRSWLRAAGLSWEECFVTNVCKYRPPGNDIEAWLVAAPKRKPPGLKKDGTPRALPKGVKVLPEGWGEANGRWFSPEVAEGLAELRAEILRVRPRVIVALGNAALWALTGEWGITEWRGSQLVLQENPAVAVVPVLHPAAVLRQYSWRHLCIHDLKTRVISSLNGPMREPARSHLINPSRDKLLIFLLSIERGTWLAVDLETANNGILCVGLATSPNDAVVFDFAKYPADSGVKEALLAALDRAYIIGQSTTAYDCAYFDACLGHELRTDFDTYIAQSVLWPGEPRDLQHLASLHCAWHRNWKSYADYDSKLRTCAYDVGATFEIAQRLTARLAERRLTEQFESRMRYAVRNVQPMMRRGVLRDPDRTRAMVREVSERCHELELVVVDACGPTNIRSPLQVKAGLERLGVYVRATNDEALSAVRRKAPAVIDAILQYRSLAALRSNFLAAKPSPDGRLRSQWSATGTETFRLTSGTDQFGGGANLLNITEGPPNLRTTIVPGPGRTYFNCDLARADVWPVVWEADDAELKAALRDDLDLHLLNACTLYGIDLPRDEMNEAHPQYAEHVARHKKARALAKRFVHLTNYGGKARTAGSAVGLTTHEAELAQRRWFEAHPGILRWHERTAAQLRGTRKVRNAFGYERPYLDRIESVLPEALAWVPQSTVALVASEIHARFDEVNGVEVQLQCYDSVAGQYPTVDESRCLAAMHYRWTNVVVPYPTPFVIPLGLATSTASWGECQPAAWVYITAE